MKRDPSEEYQQLKLNISRLWFVRDAMIDARHDCNDEGLQAYYATEIEKMANLAEKLEAKAR